MSCLTSTDPAAGPPRGASGARLPDIAMKAAAFLVLLALALLTPASALAQDCVTEITVIYGGSSGIQPPAGYTKINVDLNQGAGGDYIYVCYKKGVGAPITGLAVTVNDGLPPTDAAYTRINVDLNRNCGGDTAFIWLWYTKDPACTTIRDLHVQANTGPPPAGFTRINVDLNYDAGGDSAYIYLSYMAL